jgi:integrase
MASLQKRNNGGFLIQFTHPSRGRQTLRLGKIDQQTANEIRCQIERLVSSVAGGFPVADGAVRWLNSLSDNFHSKLAAVYLVEPRDRERTSCRLQEFLEEYVGGRAKLRPNTLRNFRQSIRILCAFFGGDRRLDSITPGDADGYREHLIGRYSPATVAREIKRARQFFRSAVRKKLLSENPFEGVKAGKQTNRDRLFFVNADLTRRVLDACPDDVWRLIFSLARFQGLRCPSEVLNLRWEDLDWKRKVMVVRQFKTPERKLPIFPEIEGLLQKCWEEAPVGSEFVIERYRSAATNLRTQFTAILERAGIEPWPRPFHNLRATRETELVNSTPRHVVVAWIGNSIQVADDHYLQTTEDHFQTALQKPTHAFDALGRKTAQQKTKTAVSPAFAKDTAAQIPPRGVEPRFSD